MALSPSSNSTQSHVSENEESEAEKAAIYARTSSRNQIHGYSIDEQVRSCWERCDMMGWEVVRVFRDEVESGKDVDRPMFQEMMSAAKTGVFDVVVFWKLDRFSRSLMHTVNLEEELSSLGVGLHSVTEQIDTTSPAGRFNFRNIANAAEFEREMIRQRTQMGHHAMALDHKWPNDKPPLGYDRMENGKLEINEDAELVRRIYRMYLEVESMPQVAYELNEEEVKPENSVVQEWKTKHVSDILKNEIYTGQYQVADVDDYVPEYRILEDELFEDVVATRHRFQQGRNESEKIPKKRKEDAVSGIVSDYLEYIQHS
jgi:site-specific DNA recombinase